MENSANLLIVDDNIDHADNLNDILSEEGYGTVTVYEGQSGIKICKDNDFELGIIDLKLPDTTGLELIKELSAIRPGMEFIIITGHGSLETASEAVGNEKIIAFEMKPVNIERLLVLVKQIIEKKSAQNALAESEEKYKNLVENSLVGINISVDYIIKFCNRRFAEIFGYETPEELTGINFHKLISEDDIKSVDSEIESRLIGEKTFSHYEVRGKKKDGTPVELEVLGGRLIYNGKPSVFGTILDITARKNAEVELNDYKNNLEILIKERTEELAASNKELKRFNKLFVGREKRIKELRNKLKELHDYDTKF